MSYPARTLFVFSGYLLAIGLILLIVPNQLFGLFQIPATSEVWIRVVGMLTLFLCTYYFVAARAELLPFFVWSVRVRASMFLFCIGFILLGLAPRALLLFGLADLAGAIWTWSALRQYSRP